MKTILAKTVFILVSITICSPGAAQPPLHTKTAPEASPPRRLSLAERYERHRRSALELAVIVPKAAAIYEELMKARPDDARTERMMDQAALCDVVIDDWYCSAPPRIERALGNRPFWLIHYGKKEFGEGGDVSLYLDATTGEKIGESFGE